jgi:hypothetical protein
MNFGYLLGFANFNDIKGTDPLHQFKLASRKECLYET